MPKVKHLVELRTEGFNHVMQRSSFDPVLLKAQSLPKSCSGTEQLAEIFQSISGAQHMPRFRLVLAFRGL